MGRFGHRVWVVTAAALFALALPRAAVAQATVGAPSGDVNAPRSAARDERAAGLFRWRSGGESLDGEMRRRLEEEERRRAELLDHENERLLRELYRDALAIPESAASLGGEETPSELFLRAVAPEKLDFVHVERLGFDRFAARELKAEWQRRLDADVSLWQTAHPHCWASDIDSLYVEASHELDEDWVARWSARFPSYWEGHPGEARPRTVEIGESLDIVELGPFALGNDLNVRCDDARAAWFTGPTPDPDARAEQGRPAHATLYEQAPRGNIYTGDFYTLDTKLRLGAGLTDVQTGFVREVGTDLICTFYSPYDRRRVVKLDLSFSYDARHDDPEVSLMVALLHY